MRRWLWLVFLMAATGVVYAQQDSQGNSGSGSQAKAPDSNPSSKSTPGSPAQSAAGSDQKKAAPGSAPPSSQQQSDGTPDLASHPPLDSLSTDTTFPGDRPANSAAEKTKPATPKSPDLTPPRSDRVQANDLGNDVGQSSSKDTQIDLSAPADDSKTHPQSSAAVADAEAATSGGSGVGEFHPWDPHKAAKSVEVGDFYFKRKNYRAAEDRYREALFYKDNDAIATIRLAVCLEKLGELNDARAEYESYLRIMPHGPQAAEAQAAIDRLKADTAK